MAARDQTTRHLAAVIASNAFRASPERQAERRRRAAEVPADLVERYRAEVEAEWKRIHGDRALNDVERVKRMTASWRRDEGIRLLAEHKARLASGDDAA